MNKIEKQQNTPEEQVARELEEDIIFGRLKPGVRLREDALLERFGSTRHFIRQALTRLERAGIVTHERNRGAKVRSFSSVEVRQVYNVRELLQRQAALNTSLPVSPEIVSRLKEINQEYRDCIATENRRGIHENNDIFHKVFYSACDNPYLIDLVRDYMDITLAIRAKNLADPGLLQVSIAHHDLMIKYLQGSDNWVLAELCVEHIRPSKERYLEMLED